MVEVVARLLDLRSLDRLEADQGEDLAQLAGHQRRRVQRAGRHRAAGQGDIDRLGGQPRRQRGLLERALARLIGRRDPVFRLVDRRAEARAFLGWPAGPSGAAARSVCHLCDPGSRGTSPPARSSSAAVASRSSASRSIAPICAVPCCRHPISCAICHLQTNKAPTRTGARGDHAVPPCLATGRGQLSRRPRDRSLRGALLIMGEPPRNDYASRLLRDFTARLGSELHRTSIADRFHPGRPVAGDFRAVTLSVTAIARYSLAWQCSRESVGGAIVSRQ